jgi:hypothetical protein
MNNWDYITKFTLKCRVKIGTALDGNQTVRVCKFGEDADIGTVFELNTSSHSEELLDVGWIVSRVLSELKSEQMVTTCQSGPDV